MSAPVILLDQDGVLADFDTAVETILENLGHNPAMLQRTTWQTFDDIKTCFGNDVAKTVEDQVHAGNFFATLGVVDGAQQAVVELFDAGCEVFVCTSPKLSNERCAADKIGWISEHFPQLRRRVIITKDKTLVRGDVLVDDKPEITGLMVPSWKHVRFATAGNRHVNGGDAIANWGQWPQLLH